MTKDVWISIESLQKTEDQQSDKIEVISPGSYYKKNGRNYVLYEEIMEEEGIFTKNTLRFDDNMVSITKRGDVNVEMLFEKNKRNMTNYVTTYGTLLVGIEASKVEVRETEDVIGILIEYSLDVNYEHLYDCIINITIRSNNEELKLM